MFVFLKQKTLWQLQGHESSLPNMCFFQKNTCQDRHHSQKYVNCLDFFPMRMYITSMFPECINHKMRPLVEWCLPTWAQGSHLWWCFRCALCTFEIWWGISGGEKRGVFWPGSVIRTLFLIAAWSFEKLMIEAQSGWWFQFLIVFKVSPGSLGKISILTNVFSNGWLNHQLAMSLNSGLFHASVRERSAFHTLTSLSRTPVKL